MLQPKSIAALVELQSDGAIEELFNDVLDTIKATWLVAPTLEAREAEHYKVTACIELRRTIRKVIETAKQEAAK